MPELPEVEHITNWLRPQLLGETLVSVRVAPGAGRCLPQGEGGFLKSVRGATVSDVRRRSKVLLLSVGERFVAIHLKMTGKLWIGAAGERSKDDRVVLTFASGKTLRFEDQRKFGWLQSWTAQDLDAWERLQGPEPIPRLPADWATLLQSRRAIKAVLLDQSVVAGIGNIYADEILFPLRHSSGAAGVYLERGGAAPAHVCRGEGNARRRGRAGRGSRSEAGGLGRSDGEKSFPVARLPAREGTVRKVRNGYRSHRRSRTGNVPVPGMPIVIGRVLTPPY